MFKKFSLGILVLTALANYAWAEDFSVKISGLDDKGYFKEEQAFCVSDEKKKHNISPEISWKNAPKGTKSFLLVLTDPDVPQDVSQINKEGVTIKESAPRQDLYHWVLSDIPASSTSIPKGAESEGVVAKGKPVKQTKYGLRGANGYTKFMAGNPKMAGTYGGYDGPCPPKNDEKVHRYNLTIYALDVEKSGLKGNFTGDEAEGAIKNHVISKATATGLYSMNPAISK